MSARRYAEDTAVPVAKSQTEVKVLLKRAGSDQIAIYEASDNSAIAFRMRDRFYRITIPIRVETRNAPQEERRAWRPDAAGHEGQA